MTVLRLDLGQPSLSRHLLSCVLRSLKACNIDQLDVHLGLYACGIDELGAWDYLLHSHLVTRSKCRPMRFIRLCALDTPEAIHPEQLIYRSGEYEDDRHVDRGRFLNEEERHAAEVYMPFLRAAGALHA